MKGGSITASTIFVDKIWPISWNELNKLVVAFGVHPILSINNSALILYCKVGYLFHTVDGSEIRRENHRLDVSKPVVNNEIKYLSLNWLAGRISEASTLDGGFKDSLFSHLFGEIIQFDEHIFQMGGSTTN